MRRRLRVQHWIACLEGRVEPPVGPNNFYNLLRVGYTYTIPADTEFPATIPQLDLFARFVGGTGTGEFEMRVVWIDDPVRPRAGEYYGPWRVMFRPGEPTRDVLFRLRHIPLRGPGRYRIELRSVRPRRRRPLGAEFIRVIHQP